MQRLYYRTLPGVIIAGHLFAGVQFWLVSPELNTPARWITQFYILLALSLLFSFLLFLYRQTDIAGKVFLIVKFIIFLLIGYAGGSYLGIEATLLTLLIVEISAYYRQIPGLLIAAGMTIATLLNQRVVEAWDVSLPAVSRHDLFSLAGYAGLMIACANILRFLVFTLDLHIQTIQRLDSAMLRLMNANVGFQEYAATAGETSAVHERKRISRDIHDTAVHTFITIIMLAENAIDIANAGQEKLSTILQQLIDQAKVGVRDTRQALRELRAIEEPVPEGLKAVYHLTRVFADVTGVEVQVDFGNLPWSFNKDLDDALYRMVQEGLTNAFRHGKATRITIHLWIFQAELIVRIHDNGQGTPIVKKGIGLQGMEERLQKFHGRLDAKNVADGFEVTARIPVEAEGA